VICFRLLSPREIRQGEEIAWYADGDTVVRSEQNPNVAYAYGTCLWYPICSRILGLLSWLYHTASSLASCLIEIIALLIKWVQFGWGFGEDCI
jgi:hypothetical protein